MRSPASVAVAMHVGAWPAAAVSSPRCRRVTARSLLNNLYAGHTPRVDLRIAAAVLFGLKQFHPLTAMDGYERREGFSSLSTQQG